MPANAIDLPDETATARLAACIAARLRPGDTLCLSGPVGAGKSAFARALIRARLDNPAEDVPSPTFTLVQTYDHPAGDIWHVDLYRLTGPAEAVELGLDRAMESAICLIEWADRLGDLAPPDALECDFAALPDGRHRVAITPSAEWAARIGDCLA